MTWTKLGDEFPPEAAPLSDAAFRTHVEALCWSNLRLLDLMIPKREVRRFAETGDPDQAVKELVESGWWEDRGDVWWIGAKFPEWQRDRAQVEHQREMWAEQQRRSRRHKVGDHSLCLPTAKCVQNAGVSAYDSAPDPGRDGPGLEREHDQLEEDARVRAREGEAEGDIYRFRRGNLDPWASDQ